MVFTDAILQRSVRRLAERRPELVAELARGPMPEPFCRVCTVLLPFIDADFRDAQRALDRRIAVDVLMYHDEPTYDVAPDDYLVAIGLAGVFTYRRCLRVYAECAAVWRL